MSRLGPDSHRTSKPERSFERRRVRMFFFLVLASLGGSESALAGDIETYPVTSIDASQGEATLFSHESVLLGLSCASGPIGKLSGLSIVNIGDTLIHGKYSIRVGLIEVSKFNKDIRGPGGGTIAKKGDVVCVLAANRRALPSEDDCNALWVRIVNCRPLK